MQSFFYDDQVRRYLIQFSRMVSNFQVEYGKDSTGSTTLYRVPVRYGDASRQAQTILQNNSANSIPSTPLMTFYIHELTYARDRVQEPYHVNKMHVRQRKYDVNTEEWDTVQGNAFTIERPMPVPYTLGMTLDIWTSNTNQKLQLLEQMLTLFNPALEIQSTDNYIDWTSLSVVELDSVNWTSRTIPGGTTDMIDIATLKFSIPIWISPPARVKKLGVINKIIAGIYDAKGDAKNALFDEDLLLGTRMQITPYGYQILLIGNEMKALRVNAAVNIGENTEQDELVAGDPEPWKNVVDMYGVLRDGISMIRLYRDDLGIEITGTVAYHPTDALTLLFTVDPDTVPANTLTAINAVIDPQRSGPGSGLAAAAVGQRYLLVDNIGDGINTDPAAAWGGLVAYTNDIIEYDGSQWNVVFDAETNVEIEYLTNVNTEIQYRWTGTEWLKSYEGIYRGGFWNIIL